MAAALLAPLRASPPPPHTHTHAPAAAHVHLGCLAAWYCEKPCEQCTVCNVRYEPDVLGHLQAAAAKQQAAAARAPQQPVPAAAVAAAIAAAAEAGAAPAAVESGQRTCSWLVTSCIAFMGLLLLVWLLI